MIALTHMFGIVFAQLLHMPCFDNLYDSSIKKRVLVLHCICLAAMAKQPLDPLVENDPWQKNCWKKCDELCDVKLIDLSEPEEVAWWRISCGMDTAYLELHHMKSEDAMYVCRRVRGFVRELCWRFDDDCMWQLRFAHEGDELLEVIEFIQELFGLLKATRASPTSPESA